MMKRFLVLMILAVTALPVFSQAGYVLSVDGNVWIENSSGNTEAAAGSVLEPGDMVITGSNSRAEVLLQNDESISIEPNSRFSLDEEKKEGFFKKVFKGLYNIIAGKFSDKEYSNAAVGTVGAIRGQEDAVLINFDLNQLEQEEFDELMTAIHPDPDKPYTESEIILLGPMLESFFQYAKAEKLYQEGIEAYPDSRLIYELLIDLYMNNESYKNASEIYNLLQEKAATL